MKTNTKTQKNGPNGTTRNTNPIPNVTNPSQTVTSSEMTKLTTAMTIWRYLLQGAEVMSPMPQAR